MANNNSNLDSGVGNNSKEQKEKEEQRIRKVRGADKKPDGSSRSGE